MPKHIRSVLLFLLSITTLTGVVWWHASSQPTTQQNKTVRLPLPTHKADKFWKGNLHTHSLWSDGNDYPEMIADWYRNHGYHFLTLSDHNTLSQGERWVSVTHNGSGKRALDKYKNRFGPVWVEERKVKGKHQVRLKPLAEFRSMLEQPGRFLLIPGEEITHRFARNPVHINGINLRDRITPVDGSSVKETIQVNHRLVYEQQKKTGRNMMAFLNHPNFGWGIRAEDMVTADELRFFEVYNGHPGVANYGDSVHPSTERMWDIVLALRLGKFKMEPVLGMCTDDAHRYHVFGVGKVNPGRGWIMVKTPFLTAENIVRAIRAGDYYCSTGVTLNNIRRDNKKYSFSIAGEPNVTYKTQFIVTRKTTSLESKAQKDKKGKPLNVTEIYDGKIGEIAATVEGLTPTYEMQGDELYIRAKVISSKLHNNPYRAGDVEVAWTQPIIP